MLKAMFDACYQAKHARDLLPALPKGVTSSFIHYLEPYFSDISEEDAACTIRTIERFYQIMSERRELRE